MDGSKRQSVLFFHKVSRMENRHSYKELLFCLIAHSRRWKLHCCILLHSIVLHCILLYCILCFILLHCCIIVFTYKMMRNAIKSSFTVYACMSLRDYIFYMGWLIRNKITLSLEWPVLSMLIVGFFMSDSTSLYHWWNSFHTLGSI